MRRLTLPSLLVLGVCILFFMQVHAHVWTNTGEYSTIQAAIDSVPDNNVDRVIITISPGIYKEKVLIPETKPYITLQGSTTKKTRIQWNDTAESSGSTSACATVTIKADYFEAINIHFKNAAKKAKPGQVGRQATAVRIDGDKAQFNNCIFESSQDTLYDKKGRHYFTNCKIIGNIDFIFGDGQSLYKGCEIHSTANEQGGSLTAQKRLYTNETTGFSFVNCKITGTGLNTFARAWGNASRTIFAFTDIANIINPYNSWNDWGDATRQSTVFYGLYQCTGLGANTSYFPSWVRNLTYYDVSDLITPSFVDAYNEGWIRDISPT